MKVELRLTAKQRESLRPIQDEIDKTARASNPARGVDLRGAVLGQIWPEHGVFYARWLNHEQYKIVARALTRAFKVNGSTQRAGSGKRRAIKKR